MPVVPIGCRFAGRLGPVSAARFGAEDAARQQTPEFVADLIAQIADGKLNLLSGGHIMIRYGKITGICEPPPA